jgi:hypothetical protein
MQKGWRVLAGVGGGIAVVLLVTYANFYSVSNISHQAIQLHLQLIGSSIYEYHSRTGLWPSRVEDLAETSLPRQSPYWKVMIDSGTNVVVWHDDLKPDPKDNADLILAYHNRGLLAWLGRHWVCWGDLRTEYITTQQLRAKVHKIEK